MIVFPAAIGADGASAAKIPLLSRLANSTEASRPHKSSMTADIATVTNSGAISSPFT